MYPEKSYLKPQAPNVERLRLVRGLAPLPETASEVCEIASTLGATSADVWLGAKATEGYLKSLSASGELAKYKVVHFATHG